MIQTREKAFQWFPDLYLAELTDIELEFMYNSQLLSLYSHESVMIVIQASCEGDP